MIHKIVFTTLLLLSFAIMALVTPPAHATSNAVLTVNSTKDNDDGHCDALGTGTGNKDCTLREAINAANTSVGVQETIEFDIPETVNSPGTCGILFHTCGIVLTAALPDIVDPVTINGYSQPGTAPNTLTLGNDAKIHIILYGANLPPSSYGLTLKAGKTTIQGLDIQKFGGGIVVQSDNNVIVGNFSGTDNTGQSASPNIYGVAIYGSNNQIGGMTPAARNLLSGNQVYGIFLSTGSHNTVQGNYIGTNAQGLAALSNGYGVGISSSNQNSIGGKGKLTRNIISGNQAAGIQITGTSSANKIRGNFIGLGANGSTTLGNLQKGIFMNTDALPAPAQNQLTIIKNRIANNGQQGIALSVTDFGVTSSVNISQNSIFNNGLLGIDLWDDNITPNDKGDGDIGPNNVQNFPAVLSATSSNGSLRVDGKLNSRLNTSYRLEFFSSPGCDASGNGEGSKYLGWTNVTTNAKGNVSFHIVKSKNVAVGDTITATATELLNGKASKTSEFSNCVIVGK